jgi:hypothetical protein
MTRLAQIHIFKAPWTTWPSGALLSQSDLVAWRSVSQEGAPGMLQRYPLLPRQEVLKLKT